MSGVIMSGRRRTVAVLAAVAALVVVAAVAFVALRGNGSEVGAQPTATPSSSAVVTPTPTQTPSTGSQVATIDAPSMKPTVQSGVAVARYFFAAYNYGFSNLDTAPIQKISAPECAFCLSAIRNIQGVRDRNARAIGGQIKVREAIAGPGEPGTGLAVLVFIDQLPGNVEDVDGTVVSSVRPSKNARAEVTLQWKRDTWMIKSVTVRTS